MIMITHHLQQTAMKERPCAAILVAITLLLFLRFGGIGHAANVQIKDLTETTSAASADLTQLEQLIGGVYKDRKITIGNLQMSLSIAGAQLTGPYTSAALTVNSG